MFYIDGTSERLSNLNSSIKLERSQKLKYN